MLIFIFKVLEQRKGGKGHINMNKLKGNKGSFNQLL